MLRIWSDSSRQGRYCDGHSRRSFLQIGMAGMGSVSLAELLRAKAAHANSVTAANSSGRDTRCILLWLDGGPSHLDLYDLKPEAPAEVRGIWKPIRTNVDGFEISELFPLQAKIADKY